jgi:hypothetical protein
VRHPVAYALPGTMARTHTEIGDHVVATVPGA